MIVKSSPVNRGGYPHAHIEVWNPNIEDWFEFDIQILRSQHFMDVANDFIDTKAAYFANLTVEQIEQNQRRIAETVRDCAIWGCD